MPTKARAEKNAARIAAAETEAGKRNLDHWLSPVRGNYAGIGAMRQAVSALERLHKFREKGRDIGALPPVANPCRRVRCQLSLLEFGLEYCMSEYEGMKPLLKRPPSPKMVKFVNALQQKVIHGGLKHVRWPRGKGKSTWVKIAVLWASLYGWKSFMVVVERVKGMAQIVVDEIWKRIYLSPEISGDFPEFAVPMRDVALQPQRMRSQTYRGRPTYMKQDISRFNYYKLPTLVGYRHTGAIIAFRGADQALRGINIESSRPDFFFIDDPQTDADAANPTTVAKIEDNINGAVLGSGETDATISAVMASTPIEPDDVSELFADSRRHPEWECETEKFVDTFGPVEPMAEYLRRLDINADEARQFYAENRSEIERGVVMMDESDFNPSVEVSAYQHALNLRHMMKEKRFLSEYQMLPSRSIGIYKISAAVVRSRLNGHPYGEVPHECDQGLLAFCDVNINAGLRWEIGAFGAGRRVAVLAYGQYPAPGVRLYPEGISESAIPKFLAPAIRTVAETIVGVKFIGEDGEPQTVRGICFDGGWQTETVASTCASLEKSLGISVVWSKGYSSTQYSRWHHEKAGKTAGLKAGEECHTWPTTNGVYLAINSDYWKEVSQTSFLAKPLEESSSSLFGDSEIVHGQFAQEICNEELRAKEESTKYGAVYKWHKDPGRPNHYGDTHAGLLVFGSIRGNFDPIAKFISAEDIAKIQTKKRRVNYVYKH